MVERPGDNKNAEGDSVSEEGDIVGTIPPPSDDGSMVGGDPGSGDQPVPIEAGAGITVGITEYERRECQYVRGDHRVIHGGGAIMKFRGGSKLVRGRSGKMGKRYKREPYYVCDLARGGRGGKLVQTRLSFTKMTKSVLNDSADIF